MPCVERHGTVRVSVVRAIFVNRDEKIVVATFLCSIDRLNVQISLGTRKLVVVLSNSVEWFVSIFRRTDVFYNFTSTSNQSIETFFPSTLGGG